MVLICSSVTNITQIQLLCRMRLAVQPLYKDREPSCRIIYTRSAAIPMEASVAFRVIMRVLMQSMGEQMATMTTAVKQEHIKCVEIVSEKPNPTAVCLNWSYEASSQAFTAELRATFGPHPVQRPRIP